VLAALAAGAATVTVLVAVGAPAGVAAAPVAADPHRVAAKISSWGPRPAGTEREARALSLMARVFQRADLRVARQSFRVPGHGRSGNVIGVLDTPRTCLRIVMAHADSGPAGPGANDNASGLGVVAALAGRLHLIKPWCDVWLAATGAEERGYTRAADHLGALALAHRAREHGARKRLRWALSLDEVGSDRPFWLRSPASSPRSRVEGALVAAARRVGVPVTWVRDDSTGNSDHREFELIGLPAAKLGVGAGGDPCRELACDVPSRLDPKSLVLARRMTAEALRAR